VFMPPPCSQIRTGKLAWGSTSGVQTFKAKQSSLIAGSTAKTPIIASTSGGIGVPVICSTVICGHEGPYSRHSRTPDHGRGGRALRNLPDPAVLAP
jgi:hypothetical protein